MLAPTCISISLQKVLKQALQERKGDTGIGFEAAISLILMAGVPVCIKFTAADTFTIGVFRLSVAILLILVFLFPFKNIGVVNRKMIFSLSMIGAVFALHWYTYFTSIKLSTASIGILGTSTYGLHLIYLGWIFRRNKPGIFDIFAVIIAIGGTWLIVPEISLANNITAGLLVAIFSGFCFALLPILHQRSQHLPDRLRTFGQLFGAWIVFMFFLPVTNWQLKPFDWWALLYLAVPGTFFSHWLWVRVTTRLTTTITSVIFYLIIPMTMVISHFWLEEEMPFQKISGAALIVSANLLSFYGRNRSGKSGVNSRS